MRVCPKGKASTARRGREKFPSGNLFVTDPSLSANIFIIFIITAGSKMARSYWPNEFFPIEIGEKRIYSDLSSDTTIEKEITGFRSNDTIT